MKTLYKLIALGFSISFIPTINAQFTFGYYPEFEAKDALKYIDFFETYGNRGIRTDEENMKLVVLHRHEDGSFSHKSFQVEVREPEEHILEFHVIEESKNTSDSEKPEFWGKYDHIDRSLDFDKAYDQFMRFYPPSNHYGAEFQAVT